MRYKDAGVDLEKQEEVHRLAASILGGGAGFYNRWLNIGGVEAALHVDGVGTKALWLIEAGRAKVAGWDCVYINVNDLVCDGFRPVAVVDYVAVEPGLEEAAAEIIEGVGEAAAKAGAVILGGETAIMPGAVVGADVACAVLGVREAEPRRPRPGDYIIGLEATGPHANGYSLLRRLFRLGEELCGERVEDVLLKPVADYSSVLGLMREGLVKAAAHITGGSFKKMRRILGPLGASLRLGEAPCWVKEVVRRGVPIDEAYKVFNMGVGMALFAEEPGDLLEKLRELGMGARVVGRVEGAGRGISVDGITLA